MSPEGFSALDKNAVICSQRAMLPIQFGVTACLQILKNSTPNGHYYLQRAVTPDQITQKNSLQRAGGHKGC